MNEVVHIAAPGPSLSWEWVEDDQTIICINLALKDAPRCDYWCCIDKPKLVHAPCYENAARLMPKVLTKWKRVDHYKKAVPGIECINAYKPLGDSWVVRLPQHGTRYSILCAVAYATHVLGAKTVHFHGVDLKGTSYFDGLNPKGTVAKAWDNRWESKELFPMHELWLAAPRNGVKLVGLPDKVKTAPPGWPGGRK